MAVIGIDLGGTKLAGAVFGSDGALLFREISYLEGRGGSDVSALIASQILSLLKRSEQMNLTIEGVGVCVPGISRHRQGTVWAPNIPGWDDYPLLSDLGNIPGLSGKCIRIDSDRACSILGESWQGAARGCTDAVFMAVGTGIGAGILSDGRVLRGKHDIAGAIGWLALDTPYQEKYVPCGCFEYYASGEGIARTASDLIRQNAEYNGLLRGQQRLTAHHVFTALGSDDTIAKQTLQTAVQYWGMAAANLVSLFNPEKIIWGGGMFGPAKVFLGEIMKEARRWAQPVSINQVSFEHSQLGSDAAIYGAARLAMENI